MKDETLKGVIKFFDQDKGYGFIAYERVNYYVYHKDIKDMDFLVKGDVVSFKPHRSSKGLQALDVRLIKKRDENMESEHITAFDPQEKCVKCGKRFRKKYAWDNLCEACQAKINQ